MKTGKRLLALFLAAIVVGFNFTFVNAQNTEYNRIKLCLRGPYGQTVSPRALEGIDTAAFAALMEQGFINCDADIDVSHLRIPATQENVCALTEQVQDLPFAFCVGTLAFSWSRIDGCVKSVEPEYRYEKAVCLAKIAALEERASELTADLQNNAVLSDAEKALVLHDRIALICQYDAAAAANSDDSPEAFTAYGALVSGKAVCHGYALAYMYLLRLIGIQSRICKSLQLAHSWDIVRIDGVEYHVDLTWDDRLWEQTNWDVMGDVEHEYFLLSSEAFQTSHPVSDYDTSPSDTRYDDFYWKRSRTAFQLVGGKLYYIDNEAASLNCATDDCTLLSVKDYWYADACGSYWPKNYSKLAGDGEKLYFSEKDAIYEFDPITKTAEVIHRPELAEGECRYIYGFGFDAPYLVYDVNDSPNFNLTTMERFSVLPDNVVIPPRISVTNDIASRQELTVSAADGFPIRGFYWGESENIEDNAFYGPAQQTVTVTQSGTYYLTVAAGENLMETQSFTFYTTTLKAEGGSVSPKTVLTLSGRGLSLPIPEKDSEVFEGWFTAKTGGVSAEGLLPSEDLTLYARYRMRGDVSGDRQVTNLDAVYIIQYESGLREDFEWILKSGDVNGDGCVNNLDAALILQFDAGLLSKL